MKVDNLVDLSSSPEKQLESVARVQDPVNTPPLPQLVEQDDLEDGDDLSESDDSEDDDDELAASALVDELERSEFEPYTDDGKCWIYYIALPLVSPRLTFDQRIRSYVLHSRRRKRDSRKTTPTRTHQIRGANHHSWCCQHKKARYSIRCEARPTLFNQLVLPNPWPMHPT